MTGRAEVFHEAVFAYNASFAGNELDNIVAGLAWERLVPRALWCALPLVLLAVVGNVWLTRVGRARVAALWLAYAVGAGIAVALPGKFWPHYYQLWLPVYAVGAGVGVHALGRPGWRGGLVGAAALLAVAAFELPYYAEPAEAWARAKYGPVFVDVKRMAPDVDALLGSDESFFEWGDESGFYYYTRRRPPTRFPYLYPAIVTSPMRGDLEARMLADLRRAPPELIIANTLYLNRALLSLPIVAWLGEAGYYRYADSRERGTFQLYIRRGGALERRLRH